MTDTKNLLPCPMCGCSNITVKNEQPADNSGGYFIECPECGISTNLCYACGDDPIPLLAELWNHRVSTQCLHQIAEPAAPHAARDLGLAALEQYLKECEENQIVADVGGAFAYAWQRAAAPQAVQPAVPVIFVSREQLESHTDHLASEAGRYLPARKTAVGKFTMPLYAHPAEGVPAQAVQPITGPCGQCKDSRTPCACALSAMLKERGWEAVDAAHYEKISQRAKSATQPAAQGMDAQDAECLEIGRELNRACVELPWGYEIILYLEQGAGTVHWMDQDGNEHDIDEDGMFSEKIGYAIAAAQAKQGGENV